MGIGKGGFAPSMHQAVTACVLLTELSFRIRKVLQYGKIKIADRGIEPRTLAKETSVIPFHQSAKVARFLGLEVEVMKNTEIP